MDGKPVKATIPESAHRAAFQITAPRRLTCHYYDPPKGFGTPRGVRCSPKGPTARPRYKRPAYNPDAVSSRPARSRSLPDPRARIARVAERRAAVRHARIAQSRPASLDQLNNPTFGGAT